MSLRCVRAGRRPEGSAVSAPSAGTKDAPGNGVRVLRAGVRQVAVSLGLSPREVQVTELVVSGSTIKEAAVALDLSVNTVKVYMRRIHRKLDVVNRAELCGCLLQPPGD